ncbi:MAG: hypothetical protein K8W52_35215 [Deltaproteobacteria bacterium]|nr:hypothetical protein [Deltaproteobacteria bacterium]
MTSPADLALLAAPSPFADPVVRLDPEIDPPPDVAQIHAPVRAAIEDAIATVGRERRAQMVLVAGDPGMGKTHQLAWLRRRADGAYACVDIPPLKDATTPFGHLARYTVQGLAVTGHLERILWDALRRVAIAVRAEADDAGDDDIVARLDEALPPGDQFARVFRMLAQQDPTLGALLYQRGRRLAPLSGLAADFGKVLCRITDRAAERALVDWLRGAELADEDLALLDVKHRADSEDRAFEVVRGLAQCAPKPIVLCLDQLESTSGLLGPDGLARMFTALMEIYQQTPVGIVLMCQSQQWAELRRDLPQAAVERVRVLPPLAKPSPDDALAILASRLAPVWAAQGIEPPYPTYPFAPAFVAALVADTRPTIRQLLLDCDARLAEQRRAGAIRELTPAVPLGTAPGPAPANDTAPAPIADAAAALASAQARYVRVVEDRKDLANPGFRQDHLREAIVDVLRGMQRHGRALDGVTVAEVTAAPKPKHGPRPPVIVALDGPRGRQRIAFDVYSDERGRGADRRWRQAHQRGRARARRARRRRGLPRPAGGDRAVRRRRAARCGGRGRGADRRAPGDPRRGPRPRGRERAHGRARAAGRARGGAAAVGGPRGMMRGSFAHA